MAGGGGNKHAGASVSSRPLRESVRDDPSACSPLSRRRPRNKSHRSTGFVYSTRETRIRGSGRVSWPRRNKRLVTVLGLRTRNHAAFDRRRGLALPLKQQQQRQRVSSGRRTERERVYNRAHVPPAVPELVGPACVCVQWFFLVFPLRGSPSSPAAAWPCFTGHVR